MPKSLSQNLYGCDDTGMAERIASESLDTSGAKEDFWGGTFDQDAKAKGNTPSNDTGEAKKISDKPDSRARSQSNH